jgi:hypothetical protein
MLLLGLNEGKSSIAVIGWPKSDPFRPKGF